MRLVRRIVLSIVLAAEIAVLVLLVAGLAELGIYAFSMTGARLT